MSARGHVPVLLEETLACLDAGRPGLYIDGTLGLAGHALEILSRNPGARLVGVDRDGRSLEEARRRLEPFAGRVVLYHADFRSLPDLDIDFASVRGVLLDLGISSFQLDDPERGFSHSADGPLDMRLDERSRTTALKVIETYSEPRLDELFRTYGEIPQSRKLAREVARRRKLGLLRTTADLRRLTEEFFRWRPQPGKLHPAARVFQALRIEVNQELEGLGEFLAALADRLPSRARLAVISFHSLEDRIVKHAFAELAAGPEPRLEILTRKPVPPPAEEVERNPRSRSAKLRAARRP